MCFVNFNVYFVHKTHKYRLTCKVVLHTYISYMQKVFVLSSSDTLGNFTGLSERSVLWKKKKKTKNIRNAILNRCFTRDLLSPIWNANWSPHKSDRNTFSQVRVSLPENGEFFAFSLVKAQLLTFIFDWSYLCNGRRSRQTGNKSR